MRFLGVLFFVLFELMLAVVWIMASKYATSQSSEPKCVTLHVERDFADVVKWKILGRGENPGLFGQAQGCHKVLVRGMGLEPEPDRGSSYALASRGPLGPRKGEDSNFIFSENSESCVVWTWSGPQRLMLMAWSQLLLLLRDRIMRAFHHGRINPIMGL